MTIDEKNIIWLDLFEFLTYHKKIKILDCFNKGEDIRLKFLSNPKINEVLSKSEINKMAVCLQDSFLEKQLENYKKSGIQLITFYDDKYPYALKQISTPPLCLYCKGNIQLLNTFCIGVVGTRKPTDYGIAITKQFVKELVKHDITIVSGMAVGVDTVAHKTTLEEGGNTIAVLAGGFNHIYPAINNALSKKIMESNLLITENNPNVPSLAYLFPIRNRIIAGLSKGIFVPEAGEKSGSMKTIDYAIEFNRDIFVAPGKINSPMSKGTNQIIKSLQGSITLCPEDILENYGLNIDKNQKNFSVQLDMDAQIVLNYIQTEKKSFQELADLTKFSAKDLNTILMELEMSGIVTKLANNSYIKT
ncbi:MAG: DNA-processing protein DprA [Clostridia bacterium]|nr:DNA-processing protein DprA [Clostridia bacterium]